MAKKINITAVCDNKRVHRDEEVPAVHEHVITVDGREVQVDTCQTCETVGPIEAILNLMENGAPVEHDQKPKRNRARGLPTMCPIDGVTSKSRAGLAQHLKSHHSQRLSQFPGGLKSNADYEGLAHSPA